MPIKPEHLDELLAGYEKPEDLLGEDGLFKQLKKALLERALGAELTHHLGYEKGDPAGRGTGNNRHGSYPKTVLTEDGAVEIEVPRDRNGSFEPQIVAKGETRLDGFDDKDRLLKHLIHDHDPAYADQWRGLDEEFQRKLMQGISAFELRVTSLQCKVKLNQHRPESHAAMLATYNAGNADEQALAGWMRRLGMAGSAA